MTESILPRGYHRLPAGCLANVVTCLEMTSRPLPRPAPENGLRLTRFAGALDDYRALFRRVGRDWMWFSRLAMADETLGAILSDPRVESLVVERDGAEIGLLELDFRAADQCELAFFGLAPEAIGHGAGRWLMEQAIARAWAKPIRRFWVHTCSFDHPQALAFYRRSGFHPYELMVEIHDDPRLAGLLPRDAGPHVPIIDP